MGFGWLFIGYFFACALAPLFSPLAVVMPVGYALLVFALSRLAAYHPRLRACFFASFVMLPLALYYGMYGLVKMRVPLFPALFGQGVLAVAEWVYFGFWCFFQCFLLYAVASLCREVGHLPLYAMGSRNIVFVAIFALLSLVVRLPFLAAHAGLFAVPLLLLQLMCVILNLWYFFKCYRTIVPDGAEIPEPPEEGKQDETK